MVDFNARQLVGARCLDSLHPLFALLAQAQGDFFLGEFVVFCVEVTGVQRQFLRTNFAQCLFKRRPFMGGYVEFEFAFKHSGPGLSMGAILPRVGYSSVFRARVMTISATMTIRKIKTSISATLSHWNRSIALFNAMPMPPAPTSPSTADSRTLISQRSSTMDQKAGLICGQ